MRKLLLFIVLSFLFQNCSNTDSDEKRLEEVSTSGNEIKDIIRSPVSANGYRDTTNVPKMEFVQDTFFFGKVKHGAVLNHEFKFTNSGNVPLLILGAKSTCGCTIPDWPKKPVLPGESGVIDVKFNTENKEGFQHKPVTITSNTYPNTTVVHIIGEVEKK